MKSTIIFNGGLGNQLFQYVYMLYLKEICGAKVEYDISAYDKYSIHEGFIAKNIFDFSSFKKSKFNHAFLIGVNKKLNKIFPSRKRFFVCDDSSNNGKLYTYYVGFWQDIKYFEAVKDIIHNYKKELSKFVTDVPLATNIKNSNSIMLHVRRGDYVTSPGYIDLTQTEYYKNAISLAKAKIHNPQFFVFSDNIEWCKSYFKDYPNFVYVNYENQNSVSDIALMSMCHNAIIANSSFSWWGASLGDKNFVFYPNRYYDNNVTQNLYPKEWIALSI